MNTNGDGVVVVATRTNVLGMIGFWLSMASLLTCGVSAIPGVLVSGFAAEKEPRGWAVAGLFVGAPGVLWCLGWTWFWVLGSLGVAVNGGAH